MSKYDPDPDGFIETMLLERIRGSLPELEALLEQSESHWYAEDSFYRFYHGSFKVYRLQDSTQAIVAALQALLPDRALNGSFDRIISDGTGKVFEASHNQRWDEETRPILEAYSHARMMLAMVVKYGRELEKPPEMLPSGWAMVLCLFGLRF